MAKPNGGHHAFPYCSLRRGATQPFRDVFREGYSLDPAVWLTGGNKVAKWASDGVHHHPDTGGCPSGASKHPRRSSSGTAKWNGKVQHRLARTEGIQLHKCSLSDFKTDTARRECCTGHNIACECLVLGHKDPHGASLSDHVRRRHGLECRH